MMAARRVQANAVLSTVTRFSQTQNPGRCLQEESLPELQTRPYQQNYCIDLFYTCVCADVVRVLLEGFTYMVNWKTETDCVFFNALSK